MAYSSKAMAFHVAPLVAPVFVLIQFAAMNSDTELFISQQAVQTSQGFKNNVRVTATS
jgi:hypothetical protein